MAVRRLSDAILLDALGTLVELEPPAPRLRRALARRLGIDVSDEQASRAIAAEISYYRANMDCGRDAASIAALRRQCAEVLGAALPVPPPAQRLGALTEALLESLRFKEFRDVRPALAAARARGQRLVVVSNWDASLHDVLDRLSLSPLLDGVITSAEAGSRKPAPEIFTQALALAGVPAERAIHVGDSPLDDVAGARAAGIEPVLLCRNRGAGPPGVRTIATLAHLSAHRP
jgi:putative hydrolase of the HAD superfamily